MNYLVLILSSYLITSKWPIIYTLKDIPVHNSFEYFTICYQYLLIRLISSFSILLSGNNGSHLFIPLFFGLLSLYFGGLKLTIIISIIQDDAAVFEKNSHILTFKTALHDICMLSYLIKIQYTHTKTHCNIVILIWNKELFKN